MRRPLQGTKTTGIGRKRGPGAKCRPPCFSGDGPIVPAGNARGVSPGRSLIPQRSVALYQGDCSEKKSVCPVRTSQASARRTSRLLRQERHPAKRRKGPFFQRTPCSGTRQFKRTLSGSAGESMERPQERRKDGGTGIRFRKTVHSAEDPVQKSGAVQRIFQFGKNGDAFPKSGTGRTAGNAPGTGAAWRNVNRKWGMPSGQSGRFSCGRTLKEDSAWPAGRADDAPCCSREPVRAKREKSVEKTSYQFRRLPVPKEATGLENHTLRQVYWNPVRRKIGNGAGEKG